MLTRIALACAALLAMAVTYMPTQASAHSYGWRCHHRAWSCRPCYRPRRVAVRRVARFIPICYGRFCSDRGAGIVRPAIVPAVVTYRSWGWWGYRRGFVRAGYWGYRGGFVRAGYRRGFRR